MKLQRFIFLIFPPRFHLEEGKLGFFIWRDHIDITSKITLMRYRQMKKNYSQINDILVKSYIQMINTLRKIYNQTINTLATYIKQHKSLTFLYFL